MRLIFGLRQMRKLGQGRTHSEIELHGTPGDISRLPPVIWCNQADQSKRGGWKIQKSTVRWVQVPHRWREKVDPSVANELFGEALGDVPIGLE